MTPASLVDKGERPELPLVEVAVALPLFHTLTYKLPTSFIHTAQIGCPVRVPVGRRLVSGYLLGPAQEIPKARLKEIKAVLDPLPRFGPGLVPFWRWLADYYHYPLGEALRQIIPGGESTAGPKTERWAAATIGGEYGGHAATSVPEARDVSQYRLGPKAKPLLRHLWEHGPAPLRELNRLFPQCYAVLKRLAAKGLVSVEDRSALRNPFAGQPCFFPNEAMTLVPEQEQAVREISRELAGGAFAPFLLHGVTASGKTEVYLAAAEDCLAEGRQVLVLLPEIALTHPVARLFRGRFGDRVSLLHSGMSDALRLDQWRRIMLGEIDVVVGARSAVFAPLPKLGLIVVDEEHDPSYKHEGGLPYQARDVALYRGQLHRGVVVLVSATPAVGTYFRAKAGKYRYLNLNRRVTPQSLPDIELVNLKHERGGRHLKMISSPLSLALQDVLSRGEQALLFLNRRGYSTVVFCLFCGEVFRCENCSVALTHHHRREVLVCHYCGFERPLPDRCPQCQSAAIKRHGIGTEKVETEVKRLFPEARVARLDRDVAPHSGRGLKILEDFAAGNLDILVGTQMITKGHHFPRVTLVGAIAADQSLFFPEYHAGERTFQLLAQVAGRAGRGDAKGRVLIQTYHPHHYVFSTIQNQDYEAFFEAEIAARRELGYPPFTRLALVRLSGPDEAAISRQARRLADGLRQAIRHEAELARFVRVLGPAPAGLAKLKGRFRWQLLVKSYGRPPLLATLRHVRQLWSPLPRTKIDLTLDIDPASLF
jgi:primosomal protein N' (replication factor Y)